MNIQVIIERCAMLDKKRKEPLGIEYIFSKLFLNNIIIQTDLKNGEPNYEANPEKSKAEINTFINQLFEL